MRVETNIAIEEANIESQTQDSSDSDDGVKETINNKKNDERDAQNRDDFPSKQFDIFQYDTCERKSSIKSASPFTQHFHQIFVEVERGLNQIETNQESIENIEQINPYYAPQFIDLLNSRFMPYCFIWASFVLRNADLTATRWTNGTIEKFIGTRKNKEKSFLKQLPAKYAIDSYPLAKGGCIDFVLRTTKSEKRKQNDDVKNDDEMKTFDAVDTWAKKNDLIRIGSKRTKVVGYYQSNHLLEIENVEIKSPEPVKQINEAGK